MSFTNSSLVSYTKISPNRTINRNHKIDTITIHCVVGQCPVEDLGDHFYSKSVEASSNYGIGYDGKIGMFVEEKDRSWCSSNASNDHRAITIECASDTTKPYAVNDRVYNSLIKLCADICKRNGIKELKWKADKSLIGRVDKQNMTVHRWFADKSCPGDYLYNRYGRIAKEVNALLNAASSGSSSVKAGDTVSIKNGATYYDGSIIPRYVKNKNWIVSSVKGDRAVIDKSADGKSSICSAVNVKYLTVCREKNEFVSYLVEVNIPNLNIRIGPGTNYSKTGKYTGKGIFTIIDVQTGEGSKSGWGKLKSGEGWISLDYAKKI